MHALSLALAALLAASGVTSWPFKSTRGVPTPLELGDQGCNVRPDVNAPLVVDAFQDENIDGACAAIDPGIEADRPDTSEARIGPNTVSKQVGSGSAAFADSDLAGGLPGITVRNSTNDGPPYYLYSINWILGCTTTVSTQSVWAPIPDEAASVTCRTLLRNNYLNCDNGGVGGYINAGCLRYTFSVSA